MKAFYSDHFVLPLPQGHRFPMQKYGRLRERIAHELTDLSLCEALPATDGQLALAHHPLWIEKVSQGGLSAQEQRLLGFPWSPAMAERSRRSVGATIGACEAARHDGFAANLAGGTHHAYADRGEGFCCFNDLAVAARWVQARSWARQVLCLDLDVHQGNGTARIFNNDPSVYTLSLHGAKKLSVHEGSERLRLAFGGRDRRRCLLGLPTRSFVRSIEKISSGLGALHRRR